MIHKLSRYIMTLVLLMTAATGAWAGTGLFMVKNSDTSATIKYGEYNQTSDIYFDGGWEDMNGILDGLKSSCTTITVDASCQNFTTNTYSGLFDGWSALTTINNIENLNMTGVTSMTRMFAGCSSLQTLDLSSWNVSSVTTLSLVFLKCTSLTTVDLRGWNTSNVEDMSQMFSGCSSLKNIYVGDGWSTANVPDNSYKGNELFLGCTNLPNWNTDNPVTNKSMAKLVTEGGYLKTGPDAAEPAGSEIELTWDPQAKTATLDEMPIGNVKVNVEYMSVAGVALADGQYPEGCTAALMDTTFVAWSAENQLMEDQRFVLMAEKAEGYDLKTTFSKGGEAKDFMKEFTKEEYENYIEYAKAQGIAIPDNAVLKWVTMPDTDDEDLTLTVNFVEQQVYTVLYKGAADELWCRFGMMLSGAETFAHAQMVQNSQMGNDAVWSMKLYSAFDPTKVAFFSDEASAAADGATMNNVTAMNSWTAITDGEFMVVGGDKTTVVAAFVADASSVPVYDSETATIDYNSENPGVTYQVVVCSVQGGNVQATNITLPAAPTAPQGKQFAGWSVLEGTAPNKEVNTYAAGTQYSIKENMTFAAVWEPLKITATFAMNGGEGVNSPVMRTYNETLGDVGEPTRKGFVLDYWMVAKAVCENGINFGKGSAFDLTTPLTADVDLTAKWKHVHEYISYPFSAFGQALAAYQKYNDVLHISICNCNDIDIVAHEFNKAGKCACGYVKPGAQPVTLEQIFCQLTGEDNYQTFALGYPEEAKKGDEVFVNAPHYWGDLEFKKWQYSADNGQTWHDLAAYDYVGFRIPCNTKARAIYVNTLTAPVIEISTSPYDDHAWVGGKYRTLANMLYQMNYKLPDGYTFIEGGIRMGDNDGIAYYEQKERTNTLDGEAAALAIGLMAATSYLSGEVQTVDLSSTEKYWASRENSVLDEIKPDRLARLMYTKKPVNVEKYPPIYWEANTKTGGQTGSIATLPLWKFAQKNYGAHWIYGIAYMRYKKPDGTTDYIYTPAVAASVDHPNQSASKTGQANARQMHFADDLDGETTIAARKAPKREPVQQEETEQLDMSTLVAPQTQLTVYADGKWQADLSGTYGYNETVSITAPAVSGKTFSYWTADGAVVSTNSELTLTMNANTKLRAVYGAEAQQNPTAAILSATRSNDGQMIMLQAKANASVDAAGFVYSATNSTPEIDGNGVTQAEAVKYSALTDAMPASVLDKNNCWTVQINPEDDATIYHVRAYTTISGITTYSDVRDVKLSTLKSGLMMIANLEAFETDEKNEDNPGIEALLTQLRESGQLLAGYQVEVPAGKFVTFYAAENTALSDETPDGISRYTISEINSDRSTATLAALSGIVAGETPMLIYNSTDEEQLVSVRATTDDATSTVTAVEQFKGTADDRDFTTDDMEAADYYVLSAGKAFVPVFDTGTISANRCWLQFDKEQANNARSIMLVFEDATDIKNLNVNDNDNVNWYDLQGRRVTKPTKGVFIQNGKKVVIK